MERRRKMDGTQIEENGPERVAPAAPGATGGETEALLDKETRGVIPGDTLYRQPVPGDAVIPPAPWGKTSGAPSGGLAGGVPAEEQPRPKPKSR